MPTTKPRHTLTETAEVARALDAAAAEWPELAADRTALLRKLVTVGGDNVAAITSRRVSNRADRIRKGAGAATGHYPDNALENLREEWPR